MTYKILSILIVLTSACTILPRENFDSVDVSKERDHLRDLQAKEKEPKVFDGELEPRMPDDDENDKTVAGIDSNNNGLRDDVEIYINRRFNEADFRRAYKQYAKAYQKWMILGEQNADGGTLKKFIEDEIFRSLYCIRRGLYGSSTKEDIIDMNTREEILSVLVGSTSKRKDKYKEAYEALKVGSIDMNIRSLEQACDFKLEKKWR